MNRARILAPAVWGLCFFGASVGIAFRAEAVTETHGDPAAYSTRSIWLAPSYQLLFRDVFTPSSRHGIGAALAYEFHLSPSFNLGLTTAYRMYPGERTTQQLGYGAVLKHFFSDEWATSEGVFPFVDYGLLLQQTFIEGRRGNAVSHDTRLGAGAVVHTWGVLFFCSLAGHYSRLDYFDLASEWIPYADVHLGWTQTF